MIVAGGLVLLARAPSDEPPPVARSDETMAIADQRCAGAARRATRLPAPDDAPAAAKVRELEAMSETFRNTTFLIAIRDAGFVCNELLRVYGGIDDSAKWMATCSEMLAYTVGVASNGDAARRADVQYFDGVTAAGDPSKARAASRCRSRASLPGVLPPQQRADAQSESSTAAIASVPCAGAMTCAPAMPGDLLQPLDELGADAPPFGGLILRGFDARDDRLGHRDAEQVLVHPARGFRRADRPDADDDAELLRDAFGAQAARHTRARRRDRSRTAFE